jgi:hypothetical protein
VVGSYSPDGRWIVYREQHPDRAPLMIMRPDGRHGRTILNVPGVVPRSSTGSPHRTANARDTQRSQGRRSGMPRQSPAGSWLESQQADLLS